jgi:hypothetical protein
MFLDMQPFSDKELRLLITLLMSRLHEDPDSIGSMIDEIEHELLFKRGLT